MKLTHIEYKVVLFPMPSDFQINDENNDNEWGEQWEQLRKKHWEKLNELGQGGYEFYDRIGPLFYFKRVVP